MGWIVRRVLLPFGTVLALGLGGLPAWADGHPRGAETLGEDGVTTQHTVDAARLAWIGLPVVAQDGEKIGRVAEIEPGDSGQIIGIDVEMGGFLGLGGRRIHLGSEDLVREVDRVLVIMDANRIRRLPPTAE
ncbi:PRC-barrel domain-containing protein [Rhodospirillum rubrum]|uniref:PRC-barrel domain-containing protein n=1 Tax=Rhodospirillum rubrum (strain ATCC 11170 / ATH 1.1.1 / DSM 467 / LMG 4362 / NCIMB 8255 / S1) TaxID=269796 RepID=Q2RXC0_RHORT|nr:PRC-barrel domain-containing protein [Rhodospirillum rubrum]ABC21225.1 hypothetical protein Rru_A0420 [Rhodospirillum rubrum ATCC 11170]AEO46900.1 hypothetical protein F11_02150 [Rhodospirillum rubrum F11]MBK5952777.1 hypothetical protein [Rhodospirillum rubrum]QXG80914.1 PRC-barrel domain-containing protein [Rhodospirillum rubrum]HAP99652.1 hypothetical protein [Rhodospirillum rubrum]